jgi:exopolysaccharide biosynthesis polyprenyl glycosylphosphotransferase
VLEWALYFEKLSGRIAIDNLSPSYFIFQEGFRKSKVIMYIRRFVSLLVAAALLLFVSPLILITALFIKVDSPGPVFYTQKRVGKNGRIFDIIKFRSMRQDAEGGKGPLWATENDPRVTRVGKVIRRMRIDEIPQLFNVLRGDIDLVGTRPERPEFVDKLMKLIPFYSLRHTVRPGLTGWAQVMFAYCGTIEESKEKLQYDLFYIKNMSIKLDLLILFKTVKIVLLGRGAR